MTQVDWSKAPEGFPIWLEDVRPGKLSAGDRDRSSWACEAQGEYTLYCLGGSRGGWAKSREGFDYIAHRQPAPWKGEGRPPVGTVCEITPHNTLWGFSALGTYHGTILAYHDDFVWIDTGGPGLPLSTRIDKVDFRPDRTAEQIKAEKEISDMIDDAMDGHMCLTEAEAKIVCTQLHKAGYRMQVSQ